MIEKRLDHLKQLNTNQYSWQYIRFHRQLAEFLFQHGYDKSGAKLAKACVYSNRNTSVCPSDPQFSMNTECSRKIVLDFHQRDRIARSEIFNVLESEKLVLTQMKKKISEESPHYRNKNLRWFEKKIHKNIASMLG